METQTIPHLTFCMQKCFIYKALSVWFFFMWFFLPNVTELSAQKTLILTLDNTLEIATDQSLHTFLNKHYYMADYWAYHSYRANPLSYTNASSLRYNSITQTDESIRTENLTSDLNLGMVQNLAVTAGWSSGKKNCSAKEISITFACAGRFIGFFT